MSRPYYSQEDTLQTLLKHVLFNALTSVLGLNEITIHVLSLFFQLLVVGGSFGLREFTQIRYDAQKIRKKVKEETLTSHLINENIMYQ